MRRCQSMERCSAGVLKAHVMSRRPTARSRKATTCWPSARRARKDAFAGGHRSRTERPPQAEGAVRTYLRVGKALLGGPA